MELAYQSSQTNILLYKLIMEPLCNNYISRSRQLYGVSCDILVTETVLLASCMD